MKKRYWLYTAILLLVLGAILLILGFLGAGLIGADSLTNVNENNTLQAFLVFGGAMLATAVVLFLILATI